MTILRLLLVVVSAVVVSANEIDKLKIMTESYPPYNMIKDGKVAGLSSEILEEMLQRMGSKLNSENFELLPWSRAYNIAQHQQNTMLYSMFRTEARENLFKWVGPIDLSVIGLIARKERNIKIGSFDEAKKYKIGSVVDDVAEMTLVEMGIAKKDIDSVSGVNAIMKSVKKLDAKRIDLFAYLDNINEWAIYSDSFDPKAYEMVYELKRNELYYAFNKETDEEIITALQKALDSMKEDGAYRKIMKRYGK